MSRSSCNFVKHRYLTVIAGAQAFMLSLPAVQGQSYFEIASNENPCAITTGVVEYPTVGEKLQLEKRFDCATGGISTIAIDENGNLVNHSEVRQREVDALLSDPSAKLHPALVRSIEQDPYSARRVLLWIRFDSDAIAAHTAELLAPLERPLGKAPKIGDGDALKLKDAATVFNRQIVEEALAPVAAALQEMQIPVFLISETAPVIGVEATPGMITDWAKWPAVDTIYLEQEFVELNNDALIVHRTLPEWPASEYGSGRRLAVMELGAIDPAGPFWRVGDVWVPTGRVRDHAMAVAGAIGSVLLDRFGSAPLAQLFSANIGVRIRDGIVTEATDWLIDLRMDVVNMSWGFPFEGELQYADRLFDYQSRYNLTSFVAAAGNSGEVHSPATAWNVIAVGAFDSKNSPAVLSDDEMWSNSSYRNPLTGVEKPNVAARGVDVTTLATRDFGYRYPRPFSGTSIAAPFVTATLALAMNRNPILNPAPEAAMATVMASAWHNIEGDAALSDRDGAGGINSSAASRVAARYRVVVRHVYGAPLSMPVRLRRGEPTRIAIAWAADADEEYRSATLGADFDLAVFKGRDILFSPEIVALGWSFSNNFELVQFVPDRTGVHTIVVYPTRFEGSTERVAVAVSHYCEDAAISFLVCRWWPPPGGG